jgi:hypothetical protein
VRFSALSRTVESALQKQGIPSRVLGGHKFFERLEVKDILAYLQLVDNHMFIPAFLRAINVPGRGIGEKVKTNGETCKGSLTRLLKPDGGRTARSRVEIRNLTASAGREDPRWQSPRHQTSCETQDRGVRDRHTSATCTSTRSAPQPDNLSVFRR